MAGEFLQSKWWMVVMIVLMLAIHGIGIAALIITLDNKKRLDDSKSGLDVITSPPPATTGRQFLIGSADGGLEWTDTIVVPTDSTVAQVGAGGLGYLSVTGASSRLDGNRTAASDNILETFASNNFKPTVFDREDALTTNVVENTSRVTQTVFKSAQDDTPYCRLTGFLQFTTNGTRVVPGVSGLPYTASIKSYGSIQNVSGWTSNVSGSVINRWCLIEDGGMKFYETLVNTTSGRETTQEIAVNSSLATSTGNTALISFTIEYPILVDTATTVTVTR